MILCGEKKIYEGDSEGDLIEKFYSLVWCGMVWYDIVWYGTQQGCNYSSIVGRGGNRKRERKGKEKEGERIEGIWDERKVKEGEGRGASSVSHNYIHIWYMVHYQKLSHFSNDL